jgi:hypothetical protein
VERIGQLNTEITRLMNELKFKDADSMLLLVIFFHVGFISKLDFSLNNNKFKMEMNSSVFLKKFKKAVKQKNVSNFV